MGRGYYMRTIIAGRYRKIVRYTRALPGDSPPVRSAKKTATNKSQQYINIRDSTEKLQWLLCANYDCKDACFLTFTFSDEHLPRYRSGVKKMASEYLRKLTLDMRRRGTEIKKIYTVEGDSPDLFPDAPQADSSWETAPWSDRKRWIALDNAKDGDPPEPEIRLHWHCFLILAKEDYDTVRALWPYGRVHISRIRTKDAMTFPRLASYVTKEARTGKRPKGERSYIPSLNLDQPIFTGRWCEDYEGISVPKDAESIQSGSDRNDLYGSAMEFSFFRLPPTKQVPKPYKGKGMLKQPPKGKKTQK